jgi:thymidine kinase
VLILGPMFSGKTTELARLVNRYRFGGNTAIMVKHSSDIRYTKPQEGAIITHDGVQYGAMIADDIGSVRHVIDGCLAVGIDEGQFFKDLPLHAVELADAGHHVFIAGLAGTFQQGAFPTIATLLPHADQVIHLSAVCECGEDAPFTVRNGRQTSVMTATLFTDIAYNTSYVGGREAYRSVCRRCRLIHNESCS